MLIMNEVYNFDEISEDALIKRGIQTISIIGESSFKPKVIVKFLDGRDNLMVNADDWLPHFMADIKKEKLNNKLKKLKK